MIRELFLLFFVQILCVQCLKYLWFTGLFASPRYLILLQGTLESGFQCCSDYLHPVVMLMLPNSAFRIEPWLLLLNNTGNITLLVHTLTFNDQLPHRIPHIQRGPYMRLDIPNVVDQVVKGLADKQVIVRADYVLYTDSDLFYLIHYHFIFLDT